MLDPLLQVAGRAHPLLLHLPIGMLVALVSLEALALIRLLELSTRVRAALATLVFLSAAASIATGLLLEQEPGYAAGQTIWLHKWLGISVGIGTLLTLLSLCTKRSRKAYPLLLLLTLGLLVPAGHFGATMTHGEGFLTEPLAARSSNPNPGNASTTTAAATTGTYATQIAPLLNRYCSSCHGESKQKGKLALHTPEAIRRGGSTGSALDPGDPDASELLFRMRLPIDDRDHMPPKDKPQPNEAEITALDAWIAAGAPFEGDDASLPEVAPTDSTSVPDTANPESARSASLTPSPAAAIDAIRNHHAHIELIDPAAGLYWVSFTAAPNTTDADAARLLAPLTDHLADLSLAGTRITDRALPQVAAMTSLRRLSLARTATTAAGLGLLTDLPNLQELNLTETKLNDSAAATLTSGLPSLTVLYAWRSGLTDSAIAALAAARPNLRIEAAAAAEQPLETEPPLTFSGDAPAPTPAAIAAAPINDLCPVSGLAVDGRFTLVQEGRTIAFCCEKCLAQFKADPAAYPVTAK